MKEQNEFQKLAVERRSKAARIAEPARKRFLSDIINTAIEGGIDYWARHKDYHPGMDDGDMNCVLAASAWVKDVEGDEPSEWTMVDIYTVEAGIATILSGADVKLHPKNVQIVAAANAINEGGDIDAEAADWIIQAGIFGEVIYG